MAQVFTDAQINEILNIFRQHMGHRQYIGARYVPIFGRNGEETIEWDNLAPYEPLTIVLYQGNSFTSRQYVPAGIDINNNEFWAETGNYNAQLEQYRTELQNYISDVDNLTESVDEINKNLAVKFSGKTIAPTVIGRDCFIYDDVTQASGTQYSAVCSHNGLYYGFATLNNISGDVIRRLYNGNSNTISRFLKQDGTEDYVNCGHANSACYVPDNNKVLCAHLQQFIGNNRWESDYKVSVFSQGFAFERTIEFPYPVYSVTYDHIKEALFAINKNGNTVILHQLDPSNYNEINTINVDASLLLGTGNVYQDCAINDNKLYIAGSNGLIGVVDLQSENLVISECIQAFETDIMYKYKLGEMQGIEFDEYGNLLAAYQFETYKQLCSGFTCVLNIEEGSMPQYSYRHIDYSITLNSAYENTWKIDANVIHALGDCNCLIASNPLTIEVRGDVQDTTRGSSVIHKDCCIHVPSGNTLNCRKIAPYSRCILKIDSGGTVNVDAANSNDAGILLNGLLTGQLTLENRGTINIINTPTDFVPALIYIGDNKNPIFVFALGTLMYKPVNSEEYLTLTPKTDGNRPIQANTIYLAPGYKINATANNA